MGEVYQARDTKLGRDVAIKVLPELLSKDEERLARFEREARVLASLNHPNIAAIYGLEDSDGVQFIVLELVDGETLAERIARGPIPIDEALPLFKQMADALEAAHEKGIIHRDLKPANVKVTPEGKVKVLDFGLAKALAGDSTARDQSESPTITRDGTVTGVLLGTAPYMSPEQARGKSLDKRTDIWSFGCCLYEALTGKKTFQGETVTDTIANVVKSEPDWDKLPAVTPWRVRDLLARCLRKDPTQRLRDIGAARLDVEDALSDADSVALPSLGESKPRRIWPQIIAATLLGGLVVGLVAWGISRLETTPPARVKRVTVRLPPTDELALVQMTRSVEISPDGSHLAYFGARNDVYQLFLRPMDSVEAEPVLGSVMAGRPFFSPDGQWIGFHSRDRRLKKAPIVGGPPVTICDSPGYIFGATWGPNDTIFFARDKAGIWSVSANGGEPQPVATAESEDMERDYRWPYVLPNGKTILATDWSGEGGSEARVVAISLKTGEVRTLVEGGMDARYTTSGHLIFKRAGSLVTVLFDLENLETLGPPVSVLEQMRTTSMGFADYSFSRDGTLVYVTHEEFPPGTLARVGRDEASHSFAEGQRFFNPRLSPDGNRLLISILEDGDKTNSWIYDLARDTLTRVTFEEQQNISDNAPAIWTPNGEKVTFGTTRENDRQMQTYWISADGRGQAERLTPSGDHRRGPASWSPDGKVLALVESPPASGMDIWTLSLEAEPKLQPFLQTDFWELQPMFAPDGRWIAYASNESGQNEVYVRPYPGPGEKIQISTHGGIQPVWSRDGRELFYFQGAGFRSGNELMSVPVELGPTFTAGQPEVVLEGDFEKGPGFWSNYDVSPDGKSFYMVKRTTEPPREIHVVLNWFEELKRLAPRN
jgi:serine/threonine-protein kinase